MNSVYLLIGSNIDPIKNTQQALILLKSMTQVLRVSNAWETPSYGSPGPNFVNFAVQIITNLEFSALKENVARKIEQTLGRTRTSDKNAPRTIDIDIIIFNNEVIEESLWERPHVVLPMSELIPELKHPTKDLNLCEISRQIQLDSSATLRPDLQFK
jgi:2-amino-4-hydroxy-6-hydroxymethyldihydropteridine diphosphokinase